MYIDYDMNCEPCMLGVVGNERVMHADNAPVNYVVKCLLTRDGMTGNGSSY
ncbi:hypothetical protein HYC85_028039 [Camellia sinensis]|uniref:Uncharacterized protein n=1 Tax=Camellia sinensis TaxID=4442 RepID=A0A7J7FW21_CAMSI|nr:hypothetical protein HYC85_028039 [Camellia sinensis]